MMNTFQEKQNIQTFLQQARTKKKRKVKKLSMDVVNMIYSNPEMISKIPETIGTVSNGEELYDDSDISLFDHYLIARDAFKTGKGLGQNSQPSSEKFKMLDENLFPFFSSFEQFLDIQDKNGDTFLHTLKKRSQYQAILDILDKFKAKPERLTKVLHKRNKQEETFYYSFLNELVPDKRIIHLNESKEKTLLMLKDILNILSKSYGLFQQPEDRGGNNALTLNKDIDIIKKENAFEKHVTDLLRTYKHEEIVKYVEKAICGGDENCILHLLLISVNFNIFNYCIKKEHWDLVITLLEKIDKAIQNPVMKCSFFIPSVSRNELTWSDNCDSLFYLLQYGNTNMLDKLNTYISNLITFLIRYIPLVIQQRKKKLEFFFTGKYKRNVFHLLALNENMPFENKSKVFSMLEKMFAALNKKEVCVNLLSTVDNFHCLPLVYYLSSPGVHMGVDLIDHIWVCSQMPSYFSGKLNDHYKQSYEFNYLNQCYYRSCKRTSGQPIPRQKFEKDLIHPCEIVCELIAPNQSQDLNTVLKFLIDKKMFDPFLLYKKGRKPIPETILRKMTHANLSKENINLVMNEINSGRYNSSIVFEKFGNEWAYYNLKNVFEFINVNYSKIENDKIYSFGSLLPGVLGEASRYYQTISGNIKLMNYWTRKFADSSKLEEEFMKNNTFINSNLTIFRDLYPGYLSLVQESLQKAHEACLSFHLASFTPLALDFPQDKNIFSHPEEYMTFLNNLPHEKEGDVIFRNLIYCSFNIARDVDIFHLIESYLKLLNDGKFEVMIGLFKEDYQNIIRELIFKKTKAISNLQYFVDFVFNLQNLLINPSSVQSENFQRHLEMYVTLLSFFPNEALFFTRILMYSSLNLAEKDLLFKYAKASVGNQSEKVNTCVFEMYNVVKKVLASTNHKNALNSKKAINLNTSIRILAILLILIPDRRKREYYFNIIDMYYSALRKIIMEKLEQSSRAKNKIPLAKLGKFHVQSPMKDLSIIKNLLAPPSINAQKIIKFDIFLLSTDYTAIFTQFEQDLQIFFELKFISLLHKHMKVTMWNKGVRYYFPLLKEMHESLSGQASILDLFKSAVENYFKVVIPILSKKEYSFEEEIILIKNIILDYRNNLAYRKRQLNDREKMLGRIISDLNSNFYFVCEYPEDISKLFQKKFKLTYKLNPRFFDVVIHSDNICTVLYSKYNHKDEGSFILNRYLNNIITGNVRKKQQLQTYFSPNFTSHSPLQFLTTNSQYLICVNPFGFLIKKYNSDSMEQEIELNVNNLYKLHKDSIANKFTCEKYSKYIQEDKSFFKECQDATQGMLINQFYSTFILFIWKCEQKNFLNSMLINKTFSEAFCAVLYHSLEKFKRKNFIKSEILSKIVNVCVKLNLFDYCNEYNRKLLLLMVGLCKNILKNKVQLIPKEDFLNILNLPRQLLYENVESLISMICYIINQLLCLGDLSYFEFYAANLLKVDINVLKYLIKYEYLSNILYGYFIFKDDRKNFKYLCEECSLAGKDLQKQYFISRLDYSKYIGYSSISNQSNPFTKLLFRYNNTTLYYLTLICNSESVLQYLKRNFSSFTSIRKIFNSELDKKLRFGLKYSLIASKNMNYILEFQDMIQFGDNEMDYYMISRFYHEKCLYHTIIKAFMEYFDYFSLEKLFIVCLKYGNTEMAGEIFENYHEKEKLLNLQVGSYENILHLLAMKNSIHILSEFLKIIKSHEQQYKYLLLQFCISEKSEEKNDDKDEDENEDNNPEEYEEEDRPRKKPEAKPKKIRKVHIPKKSNEFDVLPHINNPNYPGWNNLNSPIQYAYDARNIESFALFYDYYPSFYLSKLFQKSHGNFVQFISEYILFYSKDLNKNFVRDASSKLFICSEMMMLCHEYFENHPEMNIDLHFNDKSLRIASSSFSSIMYQIVLSNPKSMSHGNNLFERIFKIIRKDVVSFALTIFIDILNIFPDYNFCQNIINGNTSLRIKEENYLMLISKMDKVGFSLIPLENYTCPECPDIYTQLERIKLTDIISLLEYKELTAKRIADFKAEHYQQILTQIKTVWCLNFFVGTCSINYTKLALIIFKEFDLMNKLGDIVKNNRGASIGIFKQIFSLYFLLTYQFENNQKGCIFILDSDEHVHFVEDVFFEQFKVSEQDIQDRQDIQPQDDYRGENEYQLLERETVDKNIAVQINDINYHAMMYVVYIFDFPSFVNFIDELLPKIRDPMKIFQKLDEIVKQLTHFNNLILTNDDFAVYFQRTPYKDCISRLVDNFKFEKLIYVIYAHLLRSFENSALFFKNISYLEKLYEQYMKSPESKIQLMLIDQDEKKGGKYLSPRGYFRRVEFFTAMLKRFLFEGNFFIDSPILNISTENIIANYQKLKKPYKDSLSEHYQRNQSMIISTMNSIKFTYSQSNSREDALEMRSNLTKVLAEFFVENMKKMKYTNEFLNEKETINKSLHQISITIPFIFDENNLTFLEPISNMHIKSFSLLLLEKIIKILREAVVPRLDETESICYLPIYPEIFADKSEMDYVIEDLKLKAACKGYSNFLVQIVHDDFVKKYNDDVYDNNLDILKTFMVIHLFERKHISISELLLEAEDEIKIKGQKTKTNKGCIKNEKDRVKYLGKMLIMFLMNRSAVPEVKSILQMNQYLLESCELFFNNLDNYQMRTFYQFLSDFLNEKNYNMIEKFDMKMCFPIHTCFESFLQDFSLKMNHTACINLKFQRYTAFQGFVFKYDDLDKLLSMYFETNNFQALEEYFAQNNKPFDKEDIRKIHHHNVISRFYLNDTTISLIIISYVNEILYELSKNKKEDSLVTLFIEFPLSTNAINEKEIDMKSPIDFTDSIFKIDNIEIEKHGNDNTRIQLRLIFYLSTFRIKPILNQEEMLLKSIMTPLKRETGFNFKPNEDYELWNHNPNILNKIRNLII